MRKNKSSPDYKFLGNCPICNKKFFPSCASGIDRQDSVQTLYVECARCGSSVVLGIIKNMPGIVTTVGMITDMKRKDIDRLIDAPPISYDDVLEMHQYLENNC